MAGCQDLLPLVHEYMATTLVKNVAEHQAHSTTSCIDPLVAHVSEVSCNAVETADAFGTGIINATRNMELAMVILKLTINDNLFQSIILTTFLYIN